MTEEERNNAQAQAKRFIEESKLEEFLAEIFSQPIPEMFGTLDPFPKRTDLHQRLIGEMTPEEIKLFCASRLLLNGNRKSLLESLFYRHIFMRFRQKIGKKTIQIFDEGICVLPL